jgi:tetratricopeptide (TPR) repeat protein
VVLKVSLNHAIESFGDRGAVNLTDTARPAPQPGAREPFVGREQELTRLDELLEHAQAGRGVVVLLSGEAGIGKSFLAGEWMRRVRDRDPEIALCRGRCVEQYGTAEAYLPFLDGLGTLLVGPARDLMAGLLRTYAPTWCLQLPALATTPEAQETLRRQTVGATKERMLREMGDVFEAASVSGPVVGLLEDVQWADPSSADLVRHLNNRISRQRLLILLTYRPEEVEARDHGLRDFFRELRAQAHGHELHLAPLARGEVAAYLDARFPGHQFPERLATEVHAKTEGHPLFVSSLAQFLVERGWVRTDSGSWTLDEGVIAAGLEAPESTRGMVRRKVEGLTEADRAALEFAAVVGWEFHSLLLARLLQADELEVEERLSRLDRRHRLVNAQGEMELADGSLTTRYRFAAALYREVVYDEMLSRKRVLLHRRVGEELERLHGPDRRIAGVLGLHFEKGRELASAVRCLSLAGDNAAQLYSNEEAIDYYGRALGLVEKLPASDQAAAAIGLEQRLGAVRVAMGRFDEARESYLRMRECARLPGDPLKEAEALMGLCLALFYSGRSAEMAVRAEEAFQAAEAAGDEVLRLEALVALALILQDGGDLAECRFLLEEVLDRARRRKHVPSQIAALAYRGIVHYWQSEFPEAELRLSEALALALEAHDAFHLAVGRLFLGLSQGNLGRISQAAHALAEGREMARRNGDRYWTPRFANQMGFLHRELMDWDTAIVLDQEGLAIAQQVHNAQAEGAAQLNLGIDYTQAGRLEDASRALEACRATLAPHRWFGWFFGIRLDTALAEHALARGDLRGAEAGARGLLEAAQRHGCRTYVAAAHRLQADVALLEEDAPRAAEHIAEALEALSEHTAPLTEWPIRARLGRLHERLGQVEDARRSYGQAAQLVRQVAAGIEDAVLRGVFLNSPAVGEVLSRAVVA